MPAVSIYVMLLLILSFISFFLYAADKYRARHGLWRIRESILLLSGFLGGSFGALLAMWFLRHKTRHIYFWLINGFGLLFQVFLLYCFLSGSPEV